MVVKKCSILHLTIPYHHAAIPPPAQGELFLCYELTY
jgi:hypothetical protein